MLIGVDTGGTFTDFIALDRGRVQRLKLPSTPADPGRAVAEGVERLDPHGTAIVIHGTTVATNALLQGRLARVTFVTNAGFEDVLALGRQARPDLYAFEVVKPEPLVPPRRRLGVAQRTLDDGSEEVALTSRETNRIVAAVRRTRPEAIAIGLLHSFRNDRAERRLAAALATLAVPVATSAAIAPSIREYERFSTVVANAALTPLVARYLERLARTLAPRALYVFQSNGGRARALSIAERPVSLVLSGPAGGAVAAARVAKRAGLAAAIALDMGGTSTDVALIREAPQRRAEIQFAGHPLVIPALDIESVGSGGGSIARVDESGILRVGPESAGATPGPACFGQGELPTVTDAHAVLGRLPRTLAGGVGIDVARARAALSRLGKELRRDAVGAAFAVLEVVDAAMARAARLVAVERGTDPRDVELIAFGGAGGLHAARLARLLRCRGALVPLAPGHFSALGMVLADPEIDVTRTVLIADPDAHRARLRAAIRDLQAEARRRLSDEGGVEAAERVVVATTLECRYVGQTFTLRIAEAPSLRRAFEAAHRATFGHAFGDRVIEVVDIAVRATAPRATRLPAWKSKSARRTARRPKPREVSRAIFDSRGAVDLPCYDRADLGPDDRLSGPARIDDDGATILVEPGTVATVDRGGNLRIRETAGFGRRPKRL